MRRLILTTLAVLVATIPLRAKTVNRHDMSSTAICVNAAISRDIKVGTFKKIYAEGTTEVQLKHGSVCSVRVEGTDTDLKFYNVKVSSGTLCCKYKGSPSGSSNHYPRPKIKLYVTMPNVRSIELRGISCLKSTEIHSQEQLTLRCNGSATITTDYVNARESVWMTTEGVSKIQTGNIHSWGLHLAASGSSSINVGQVVCDEDVSLTCSGGASIQSKDIQGETMKANVSGCSKVKAEHIYATKQANIGLSGNSTLHCIQLTCKEGNVLTEGASQYEGDIQTKGVTNLTSHGCGKVESDVKAENVVLNLTGSSQAKIAFNGKDATLVCEGASSAKVKLACATLRAIAHNIAKIQLNGSAHSTEIDAAPNAKINVSGLKRF